MSVLPDILPSASDTTDIQQDKADVADEGMTNRTPHRPPCVQLIQNNSSPISPGPMFIHGPTLNTDQNQTYRILPIIAGILIPFMVLLSIPGLTNHWYVRIDDDSAAGESRPNHLILVVAMSLSLTCGVLANICLVLRFAERSVKEMTLLCIILLSINELINIPAVIIFAVTHRFDDGLIYGQSFWMTVCSMVVSATTNIILIIDYIHTKHFIESGSGLTHKQRSLVIMIIVLICYITFGSLVQTFILKMIFIDALYFTVVSLETIGFGDIHPTSTGTRIFISLYIAGGILNLALTVALSREVLLEAAVAGFRERIKKLRAHQRKRHIRNRWKAALKWRLQAKNLPLWIANDCVVEPRHDSRHHHNRLWTLVKRAFTAWKKLLRMSEDLPCYAPSDKQLNLKALTEAQLEAAALEAGAPLADLLPSRLEPSANDAGNMDIQPQPPLTHMRMGGMISLLGQFAIAFAHSEANVDNEAVTNNDDGEDFIQGEKPVRERLGVPFTRTVTTQDEEPFLQTLEAEEKFAFIVRLSIACLLFIVFWAGGSVIFMTTEGWSIGTAVYFCFVAFSTVGYGDFAPKTQAGRSIFVAWALLGVAIMTILISILTEAYSKSYKSTIRAEIIKAESSTEDASISFMRQRCFDSRTVINTQEFSPYIPQSPFSQCRNVTFSSLRNDHTYKRTSESLNRKVKGGAQKQTWENMTALSLDILRHTEKLQSLLNSAENAETLEVETYVTQVEKTIQDIVAAAKDGFGPSAESMV